MKTQELEFDAGSVDATTVRLGVVAARFNGDIVERLLDGALEALTSNGADRGAIDIIRVPGAFEVPVALRVMAASGRYDALVALGTVIRGDTPHFDFVAGEAARGCQQVALEFGVPIGFGILTTDTLEQAEERAGGAVGNKGAEAALSAVETANVLRRFSGG